MDAGLRPEHLMRQAADSGPAVVGGALGRPVRRGNDFRLGMEELDPRLEVTAVERVEAPFEERDLVG